MISNPRSDLAAEARSLWQKSVGETGALPGVKACHRERDGFAVEQVDILTAEGSRILGKAPGRYVTVELPQPLRGEPDGFRRACRVLAAELEDLLNLENNAAVLVLGLGNRAMTPDALGPLTADHVLATRHLREGAGPISGLRPVAAVAPGVLGRTGVESGETAAALCRALSPACVIAVDALAAADAERLCRTVQLTDTGIVPGSGVGSARHALTPETLGRPVIAMGVPTVIDAAKTAAGRETHPAGGVFVTPRDIDRQVQDLGRLLGYAVDLALQPDLSPEDLELFLS